MDLEPTASQATKVSRNILQNIYGMNFNHSGSPPHAMMINKLLLLLPTFTMLLKAMPSCFLVFFLLLMQSFVCFPALLPGRSNETDRLSLLAFKAQIKADPQNVLRSWNESLHFCDWSGVTCGRRHQRVVELRLRSRQLKGRLAPHIGNLSFLRVIDLRNNSFSQEIPQEIGRLFRLQSLVLSNNTLTGEIPVNISRCSKLLQLDLGVNNLTGKVPAELGSLSKLQLLGIQKNNLAGEIPSSFGNLSSLEVISGVYNNLHGIIPDGLGKLNRLEQFYFGANNLSGSIPPSMYNLSSLAWFSVTENQLQGNLPPNVGLTLPNLQYLGVSGNRFSGLVPATIANMTNLLALSIAGNNFSGKVPPNLSTPRNLNHLGISENSLGTGKDDDLEFLLLLVNNTSLEILSIDYNNFGGFLPRTLGNFSTKLRGMTFGRNKIRGSIPAEIGNLISLAILGLEGNHLTGSIPDSVGMLQNLGMLGLGGNEITGGVPPSLGNLTSLLQLGIGKNRLHGTIPASLGNCQSLMAMTLSQNNLSGDIPKEIFSISSFSHILDLADNQLSGSIPSEVSQLVNLGILDFSSNKLSNEIPRSISNCESLEELYLEDNNLQGIIPQSLSSLKAIKDLDLSRNNLTGQIPSYLGDLKLLEYVNLSFNNFEGEVPTQGVFKNASKVSVLGNNKLCGGVPELLLQSCSSKGFTKPNNSSKVRLIIEIGFGLLGLTLLMISLLSFHYLKKKKKPTSCSSFQTTFKQVAYQDILKATDGFSSTNVIGVGSFGTVYKGNLDLIGAPVAVKVFNLLKKAASRSFMAECEALTNIKHRNLVKVVTVCSSIDFQGNDFKALIYEFMANGSLEEWLHPAQSSSNDSNIPKKLNLIQRLNIALDVANAIEYLHHHCETPIVHCDLKPSNVLLDGDLTAHVGDFGLARILKDSTNHSPSNNSSSIGIKGTIGYAAPEYGMGSDVSTFGDVYSYGILLLEMFTGKRPTDAIFKDGLNLYTFVKSTFCGVLEEIADPMLIKGELETSDGPSTRVNQLNKDKILKCIASIFKVGMACSAESIGDRMDIKEVGPQLQQIKRVLLGKRRHGPVRT